MRLRTNQIFIRISWAGNVLADQGHHQLKEEVSDLLGTTFDEIQNLARSTEYLELTPSREQEWFPTVPEDEVHPTTHVAFRAANEELRIFAGPHPYTGRYVVQCELLMARERFEDADFTDDVIKWFRSSLHVWDPICAHAHDADDNSIQNTASPGMLRIGFGVEVDEVNLADNPGREISRGEYRYAVNWLSFFGPEMVERIERYIDGDRPEVIEEIGEGWFLRLYNSPLTPETTEKRQQQRNIRKQLCLHEVTEENARSFGFWQRT